MIVNINRISQTYSEKAFDEVSSSASSVLEPKKVVWKKVSLYWWIVGWAGVLLCENFSFEEYKDIAEWCKESYNNDDIKIQFGINHLKSNGNSISWIDDDPLPKNISLLRIYFKNEYDATAFKVAWA